MPQNAASDLGLHCLQITLFVVLRLKKANWSYACTCMFQTKYNYLPLNSIHANTKINVYGVVRFVKQPYKSRGSGMYSYFVQNCVPNLPRVITACSGLPVRIFGVNMVLLNKDCSHFLILLSCSDKDFFQQKS